MDVLKSLIWSDESKEVSTGVQGFNAPPILAAGITCIAGPSVCGAPDPKPPIYAAGITCIIMD